MKKVFIPFILLVTCFTSCLNDDDVIDCSTVLCEASSGFYLEIIKNGEDVFANGTYTKEDVSIVGQDSEDLIIDVLTDLPGKTEALLNFINVNWSKGPYEYTINLGTEDSFQITGEFAQEGKASDCCGILVFVETIAIQGASITDESGIYTVTLD
ncbi:MULTISPECIES: hypothetical protein [Flavobacteriaceae]|uniref:hypothetical protein n=1 Tax=Flavobacteriaceae TaxID=49546 RepID=UPI001491D913|nr:MULTISPECIES: hypothetical protein [Allomuricauda]MDC6365674.1 hypothetical protein [Muricauda sp. AC10]